jgi:signal transduction histidine kinase
MKSDNEFDVLELLFNFMPYVFWKDKNGIYYGANLNQAKALGLDSPSEMVGKNIFELLKNHEQARLISENEARIMHEGLSITFEESIATAEGNKTYISQRHPFKNEEGIVEGLLGFSIDVSDLPTAFDKNEFLKNANQLTHDVNAPIATIMMIAETVEMPKEESTCLKEAAVSIKDKINKFLKPYKQDVASNFNTSKLEPVLVSAVLMEILESPESYNNIFSANIEYCFEENSNFCFINADYLEFKYIISNILANVANIFDNNNDKITLKLECDSKWIRVIIKNEGKELSPKILDEITKNNELLCQTSYENSLEFAEIRELIKRNNGTISIDSRIDKGTTVTLIFRLIKQPKWIINEITLNNGDIIVILDDDISGHAAWNARFEPIMHKAPAIQVKHFELEQDAIDFFNSLTIAERKRVFFLTKYILFNPDLNGVKIIRQFKLEAKSVVLAPFHNRDLIKSATGFGIKLLPEILAPKISITLQESFDVEPALPQNVEVIIVDDNQMYSKMLMRFAFPHQLVEEYYDPEVFLESVAKYPKEVKICLDNHFANSDLTGLDLARQLHEKGYSRLYLLSGKDFNKKDIPKYLTAIAKDDLHAIKNKLKKK